MTIQSNFPAIKPSLNLDFANVENLDPRITFARASTATYYGTQTALAEQNLLLQSQDFTTTWGASGGSITANTTLAPDGTTTADTYTASATTSIHRVGQSVGTAGQTRTISFFAKAGTHRYIQVYFDGDGQAFANFDVVAGGGVVGTNGTSMTTSIVDVGNNWYRCIATLVSATAGTSMNLILVSASTSARAESWATVGTETVIYWGAQLEQRSAPTAYTVTTTQPITNYIPVLLTAAAGVPRFDHNPVTFESLGLEIEQQRTNLVTYSEQFDNAAWIKSNATITSNTIVAPDGTLTGDRLFENAITSAHFTAQSFSATSGTTYTFSVFAKNDGRFLSLGFNPNASFGGAGAGAFFNLSTGVVNATFGTVTASITPVGNGWFRCAISSAPTVTGTANASIGLSATGTASTYTGDGYSGLYIWGAQLEAGAFSTSYIPTVASQVTRAADSASMTGTNFSSWYNQGQGAVYCEYQALCGVGNGTNGGVYVLFNGSGSDYVNFYGISTNFDGVYAITNGQAGSINVNLGARTANVRKAAFSIQVNDFAGLLDPNPIFTDTSFAMPLGINAMQIGGGKASYIRKISYYPIALTDTQLQALTG